MNWAASEHTFDLMKHYFKHGVRAYMYWNMVLDETGKSQWGWKQNAMISIERSSQKVIFHPEFFLMKHFSYFIKPGAKKIKTRGDFANALVFQNPNGQIIIILVNHLEKPKHIITRIGTKYLNVTLPSKSFNTFTLTDKKTGV